MNGYTHASKLRNEFSGSFGGQSEAAKGNLVVGEWSASLSDRGMGGMADGEKDAQRREFVKAQLEIFDRFTGGWWYWTYKKAKGWDAGWCARDAATAEILPAWVGSRAFKGPPPGHVKDQALEQAHSESRCR
jgi:glucan 1,3-beta-glucosidase